MLTWVTSHHRNMTRVSLPIHSLPRGAVFSLNTKKAERAFIDTATPFEETEEMSKYYFYDYYFEKIQVLD